MGRMLNTPLSAAGALYDSAARPPAAVEELIAVVRYRDLIGQLMARDIKTRYKRSVLGIAWTMVSPLLTMTVLTIVFGQLFQVHTSNYPAYLLSGVLLWNYFAQTTTGAMHQLMWGGSLFHRAYVPRTVITIAAVGTGVVNLLLALVPLAIIMAFTGAAFSFALIWILPAIAINAVFALGISLLLSTLSISFADVIEMYVVVLNAWFFLTPVMYPVSIVPSAYVPFVVANPMYYLLALFRAPIHEAAAPDPVVVAVALIAALASLVVGWITFTSRADRIAYST